MATGAFDFIVVGAGSAGCAVANRLSSDPSVSVLLLEAGGSDDREAIRVPRQYFSLWGTDVDWQYVSTPQAGTMGRVHPMPRGRVLGGTSSINGMVYLRGAASDYDNWAALGCAGWDWESVRVEFDDLETWLRPARLQQRDGDGRVGREPVGQRAPRRPGPDDHEVVGGPVGHLAFSFWVLN